jgi:hypothetical protein
MKMMLGLPAEDAAASEPSHVSAKSAIVIFMV